MTSADEILNAPIEKPGRGELLLEVLSEEIPARMQRRAIEDLTGLLRDKLAAAEIPASKIVGYVTPRRLTVIAEGIPATQPDRTEERRGPRLGAPQPAIDGFLRSAGLGSIDECEIRDTGRGGFYFAVVKRSGRPAPEVLPDLIRAAIVELPWPKSMRWPGASVRWVRPLTSVICLFDGEALPLALDSVPVGRTTRGHRFMAPGEICVGSAADYIEKLEHAYVIVDQERRKEIIRADLERLAAKLGVAVKPDPALLDEVTGLAEFPVVLAGAIDPDFMTLPPEVLQTAMRVHQKYFSCVHPDGRPAPHFLFVANNLAEDRGAAIVAGNERVLRARLADARFFWDQDRKIRLEDRVEALKGRVYHAKLGSVYDKVQRTERLAAFLAEQLHLTVAPAPALPSPASGGGLGWGRAGAQGLPLAGTEDERSDPLLLGSRFRGNDGRELGRTARRAAHLAKADLSTGMVGEFPDLQGVMGRYYALDDGEDEAVADAIADHYKPVGSGDDCPGKPVSIVAALADKIDTLVAFFAIGEKPTGSRDPFALRRAALGVIRIILERQSPQYPLRLPLAAAFARAHSMLGPEFEDPTNELLAFFVERLRTYLRERGFRHDMIAAALARAGEREDDLARLRYRVEVLQNFIGSEVGANLLIAYRRASNIVAIEERKDGCKHDGEVNPALLKQPEEQALFDSFAKIGQIAKVEMGRDVFETAISQLARLRHPIDIFFLRVTVNTDEPKLRENRLRLLSRIRATMNQVADFSQIEG
jgi:glycyl-tRNA synthetase beta chain